MQIVARIRSLFHAVFRRDQMEREMVDELQFHLEACAQRLMADQGLSRKEAMRRARVEFGSVDKCKEVVREALGLRIFDELRGDLRYAFRQFGHYPIFTTVAIAILALGIGANTAIFSFVDAVVFRPLPVFEPERLMSSRQPWSLTDCEDVRRDGKIFSGLAAYFGIRLEARDSNYDLISGRGVTANFFEVLGLKMISGRGFLPGEDSVGGPRIAVISHRYWQRIFHGDPAAVGKSILLNKEPVTVVGVAPKNFRGLSFTGPYQDIYLPIPVFLEVMHIPLDALQVNENQIRSLESRDLRAMSIIGRLRKGVSQAQASARMHVLAQNLAKAYPSTNVDWQPTLVSANRTRDPGRSRFSFGILAAGGICILLITCTNVAGLLLARGSARRQEIATRFALGASRLRVIRQLLAESLVLSAAAVAVGLAVSHLMLRILPVLEGSFGAPLVLDLAVDRRLLVLAVCIGLLTGVLCGLAPALVTSRSSIGGINQKSIGFDRGRARWRRALVVVQIALSVILLVGAGLFARTILHSQAAEIVYDRNCLFLTSDFLSTGRSPGIDFYIRSLLKIRQIPGVQSAAWAAYPPLEQALSPEQIRRDQPESDSRDWLRVDLNSVSPAYFESVGIPFLQGRDFTDRDDANAPAVMVVNETLAHQYWPEQSPIGKHIQLRNGRTGSVRTRYEVVGVVKDVKYRALDEAPTPYAYRAFRQTGPNFNMYLHVAALGNPKPLIGRIRKACEAVNPKVGIGNARLISEQLESSLFQERSAAFVLGVFGPFSLVLAAVGLYGVIAYSLVQRSTELGIRMALGAQRFQIIRMVVFDGVRLVFAGLLIGISASMALSRVIAARLHGVSPVDPTTYVLVSVLCFVAAVLAAALPAVKARNHPVRLLRSE